MVLASAEHLARPCRCILTRRCHHVVRQNRHLAGLSVSSDKATDAIVDPCSWLCLTVIPSQRSHLSVPSACGFKDSIPNIGSFADAHRQTVAEVDVS